MKNLQYLCGVCLLVLAGVDGCAPVTAPEAAAPNLLFVITDDQRFDMMGNMNADLHTPMMDWLAENGVRFEQAFVTTPICAASRASLLAGVVERTHRYTFITPPLADSFANSSYPALLKRAGYQTAHIGKFGVNLHEGAADAMFTVFEPLHRNPYFKEQSDGSVRHLTDITADRAIAFLDSAVAGPFALTLSFNAPHAEDSDERQFIWPAAMDTLYEDLEIATPPLAAPAFHDALPQFLRDPEINMNRYRWFWRFDNPQKASDMTKGYYRMISGVDAALARVMDKLEALDVADNTVIVLMGDNGYFLGERGYAGKWLALEPSIRVPLLLYDPRNDSYAGLRPTAMALNIDVAPTLLDLAGIAIPASMQGHSLLPLLDDNVGDTWRTDFFIEHLMDHKQIVKHEGVRGEKFKYTRYFELDPVYEELYNLANDSLEQHNLADNPDYAQVLKAMRTRTDELRDRYGGFFRLHNMQP
ncbi:MAG: sulfatase [Bacteroidota bacterium]